jgi:molybdenum cofactor biosynthesis protein MoaC
MKKFTHLDQNGKPVMVDVSGKEKTLRKALAYCEVSISKNLFDMISGHKILKGDVLTVAKIAGIQAAKKTYELIPLCHNISISKIDVDITPDENKSLLKIFCTAVTEDKTGIEMEALTGAAVAALTIYDMCKSIEKSIVISDLKLLSKSGGKSGVYNRKEKN